MNQYLERFRQSLNLRTMYGLIALGCLLGFALIGSLNDAVQRASLSRAEVDARLTRHGGAIDETIWNERAADAEAELAFWQSTHWSGSTSGVIAAELENAISQITRGANLRVINVNVDPAPSETPSGPILRFSFSTDSNSGDSVAKILAAFGAHQPVLVIDEVNAVFDESIAGRFSASGYAPVSLLTPPQENG